jgi:hypothetical protein
MRLETIFLYFGEVISADDFTCLHNMKRGEAGQPAACLSAE